MPDLLSKSEFAATAGVSKPAISGAIKRGHVVITTDSDGNERIDITHPVNSSYIGSCQANRDKNERHREGARNRTRSKNDQQAPKQKISKAVQSVQLQQSQSDGSALEGLPTKIEMEIRRLIQQEEKDRIANAVAKKNLIPREEFTRRLDRLISVLNNHFLPYAQRVTPPLCGALGVIDPELKLKAQEMLTIEMERALKEFKREAKHDVRI